jgi:hypothetical protein
MQHQANISKILSSDRNGNNNGTRNKSPSPNNKIKTEKYRLVQGLVKIQNFNFRHKDSYRHYLNSISREKLENILVSKLTSLALLQDKL